MSPKTPDSTQGRFEIMAREIDWESRISVSGLLARIHERNGSMQRPTQNMEDSIDPEFLAQKLYIPQGSHDREVNNAYLGVVFPSEQFTVVVRGPADLARAVWSKTMAANRLDSDKEEVTDRANRAVSHALGSRLVALESLRSQLGVELVTLREIHRELNAPGRSHFMAKNLHERMKNSEMSMIKLLKITAESNKWQKERMTTAQGTLNYLLYGTTSNQRIKNWRRYNLLAGKHVRARYEAVGRNADNTKKVKIRYEDEQDI